MKLIGILCWYDERPADLAESVASLAKADVSHLIAVDGAYGLYPDGRASSPPEQAAAIRQVCTALDIGFTIHAPQEPFFGNEVEKRNLGLRLAETVADPFVDWYLIHDADHVVTQAIGHIERLEELDSQDHVAADVRFVEPYGSARGGCPGRYLIRAIPGIAYRDNHYTLGSHVLGNVLAPNRPAADLSCIEVEHRRNRDPYRRDAQEAYYRRRDETGAEAHLVTA